MMSGALLRLIMGPTGEVTMGRLGPDGGPSPGDTGGGRLRPARLGAGVHHAGAGRWRYWRDSAHDILIRLCALFLAERAQTA